MALHFTVINGQLTPITVGLGRTLEATTGKLAGSSVSLITQASTYVSDFYTFLGNHLPSVSGYMGKEIAGRSVASCLGYATAFADPAITAAHTLYKTASAFAEYQSIARQSRDIRNEIRQAEKDEPFKTHDSCNHFILQTKEKIKAHEETSSFSVKSRWTTAARTALNIGLPIMAAPVIGLPMAAAAVGTALMTRAACHVINTLVHRHIANREKAELKGLPDVIGVPEAQSGSQATTPPSSQAAEEEYKTTTTKNEIKEECFRQYHELQKERQEREEKERKAINSQMETKTSETVVNMEEFF